MAEQKTSKANGIILTFVEGGNVDFRELDLSAWGIRGAFVDSNESQDFIKSVSGEYFEINWTRIIEISSTSSGGNPLGNQFTNLLWPIDTKNCPTEYSFFEAIGAIKVLHPSELHIQNTFSGSDVDARGTQFINVASYDNFLWYKFAEPEKRFFTDKQSLPYLNKVLPYFKSNYDNHGYIKNAISYYISSYDVNTLDMAFLCLCICLETIVPGNEQLSYRLRRNITVLIAETMDEGKTLFGTIKDIYNHRSKLVHGGSSFSEIPNSLDVYIQLEKIASRMISELLLHNIPLTDLDNNITELGYCQKESISKNYLKVKGQLNISI